MAYLLMMNELYTGRIFMCTYFSLLSDWTHALGLCLSQQAGFNNQNNTSSALPLNADTHTHTYKAQPH